MGHQHGAVVGKARRRWVWVLVLAMVVARGGDGHGSRRLEHRPLWSVAGQGRAAPDADDNAAYFLSRRYELVAVHVETGSVRWRAPLGVDLGDIGGSRVVVADGVVIAGGSALFGFDATSGRRRWRLGGEAGYGAGLYLGARGTGTVFAGSTTGRLFAIATESGAVRWAAALATTRATVYAPVTGGHDIAAAFTDFDNPLLSGLVVVDAGTGEERWRTPLPVNQTTKRRSTVAGGPVFAGSAVVVTGHDGAIYAFDRHDGSLKWSLPASAATGGDPDYRPMAVADRTLVVGSLSGELVAFDTDTRRELWRRIPVRASVAFALVAAGRTIYVPYVSGELVELSSADGREVRRLGGSRWGFRWPPRVTDGRVFLAGSATGFFAFAR